MFTALEYGFDDVYGRSLDEEVAVSPSTAGTKTRAGKNVYSTSRSCT